MGRTVTNLGSCKIRAGRGRGLRRRVEEKRPGREVEDNQKEEREHRDHGSVDETIESPHQMEEGNGDQVNNESAVKDQNGGWKMRNIILQWTLAFFSALYLVGPTRLLSILYSLPSYEWILTWGSGVFIASLAAKFMLSFTVFCLGEAAYLSLVYYLCPNRLHVCLYRILGKKPASNIHLAELDSSATDIGATRHASSNSSGRRSVSDQQTQHSMEESAHTVGPQSNTYRSVGGQPSSRHSSTLTNRTFTYDREPVTEDVHQDSREYNSGRGYGQGDRFIEENRSRPTSRRTPGSGLGELLRQSARPSSGGWNGNDFAASTPAVHPQNSSRRNVSNASSQNRNFRSS